MSTRELTGGWSLRSRVGLLLSAGVASGMVACSSVDPEPAKTTDANASALVSGVYVADESGGFDWVAFDGASTYALARSPADAVETGTYTFDAQRTAVTFTSTSGSTTVPFAIAKTESTGETSAQASAARLLANERDLVQHDGQPLVGGRQVTGALIAGGPVQLVNSDEACAYIGRYYLRSNPELVDIACKNWSRIRFSGEFGECLRTAISILGENNLEDLRNVATACGGGSNGCGVRQCLQGQANGNAEQVKALGEKCGAQRHYCL